MQVFILGAGHAGSSAALSAAKQRYELGKESNINITIIDKSPNLTIRPRLYEYELEDTQVPLRNFLEPVGVDVITGDIIDINLAKQEITYVESSLQKKTVYDALVISLGSQLKHPNITGMQDVYNIDSFVAAKKFRDDLVAKLTNPHNPLAIAILGGGITGLELATELPVTFKKIAKEYNVTFPKPTIYLLDRNKISKNVGASTELAIQDALDSAGINCIDFAAIDRIENNTVVYNQTKSITVDLIVSTLGLRANKLSKQLNQSIDSLGRVYVNKYLQLSNYLNCFCAGDIAHAKPDETHPPIMSCQQGRPQGRYAGYNAIAFLSNQSMRIYSQPNYVTCIDLGRFGAVYTQGWERTLVKTGVEAKKIKQHINQERIYPPNTTNKNKILEAGALAYVPPMISAK